MPRKHSPYIQVNDVLCYELIPIIYRTSLLQNSLKVIIGTDSLIPQKTRQHVIVLVLLQIRTLRTDSEKSLRDFFEPLLQRLHPSASKIFKEEVSDNLTN